MTRSLRSNIASTMGISSIGFLVVFASQIVISYHFGASAELDAYWTAFALMNLLAFPLVPLREALVPEFHRRLQQGSQEASAYFSRAMTLILLVAAVGTLAGWLLAEPLTALAVSKKQLQIRALAVNQLYWLAPAVLLLGISETLNAILISYHRVVLQAFCRTLGAASTLAVLALFAGTLQTHVLPLSFIAAQVMTALLQIVFLRRQGLIFRLAWPGALGKRFLSVSGALLAVYAASQGYAVLEKHTLTNFSAGLVSSFQYSMTLTNIVITLVGISLSNVLWPRFLEFAAVENRRRLYGEVSMSVRFTFLVVGWLCSLIWINANAVVELIYARGAFDASAVARTADALRLAIFAAVPISAGMLIGRALISLGAARSVVAVSVATTVTGIVVLVGARLFENSELALCHWLLANTIGLVTNAMLLARACGGASGGHVRTAWWLTRWLAIMALAGITTEMIPAAGAGFVALVTDMVLRATVFTALFAAFAWATGLARGLPSPFRQ